ncbi:MAG: hypothetical protein HYX51_11380 [Chloroflexi bacterium]|nr:hypothetical protein [Chloroflexota bacterium]
MPARGTTDAGHAGGHPAAPLTNTPAPSAKRTIETHATIWLLVLAVAIELVLAFGWLRPLGLWDHQANPPDGAPMVTLLGRTRAGALRFAVPAAALVLFWGTAVWIAGRARGRTATAIVLGATVVFAATLVPMFPGGTQDIFHNVADARLLWLHGENPMLVPPIARPDDAFYRHLFGYADLTSAYGPLWYALAGIPMVLAGDGLVANLVAQKGMMAVFMVATTVLVWLVARSWPHDAELRGEQAGAVEWAPNPIAAVVLAGWCPLLLWETAGNGHNDAVMVFFAAAAVAAALRRWWLWVFPLLALSALVKFTTLLLGPVLLVWLLRRSDVPRRSIIVGLALATLMVVLAYIPFWAGADTFTFLKRPGMTFILSPSTLLHGVLVNPLGDQTATRVTYAATFAAFASVYTIGLLRPRSSDARLAAGGFDAVLAYLVFASWWFWPWYLAWLAPLAAWQAGGRRAWVFVAATGAALLTYCYWWSDPPERSRLWYAWYILITAGVFVGPALLWASGLAPSVFRGMTSTAVFGLGRGSGGGATSSRPHDGP